MIDVRTEAEHHEFNIGVKNIPLDELENKWDILSFDKPLICYCAWVKRSAAAARIIRNRFHKGTVHSLKNGITNKKKHC